MSQPLRDPPNAVDAARHLCQEARVVLTSLRGGPPNVARGELATDLMDLRSVVKAVLSESVTNSKRNTNDTYEPIEVHTGDESVPFRRVASPKQQQQRPSILQVPPLSLMPAPKATATPEQAAENKDATTTEEEEEGEVVTKSNAVNPEDELGDGTVFVQSEPPQTPKQQRSTVKMPPTPNSPFHPHHRPEFQDHPSFETWTDDVGPFARPFLAVIVDPRAAGPHTLVALRSLFRLVEQGSLLQASKTDEGNPHPFTALFESLTKGVLSCKFEQTDAGADEAVEMAIADLLALLVKQNQRAIRPDTLMDAFNTVFVTRNTFVHSPALCYHFEDVLTDIVSSVFSDFHPSATLILEFLVNQLLHTPLVGGDVIDESMREAQMAHAATRLLCLRLVNCAIRTGWDHEKMTTTSQKPKYIKEGAVSFGSSDGEDDDNNNGGGATADDTPELILNPKDISSPNQKAMKKREEEELLRIIKDDLCLSLLMTGQAIWTYHDSSSNISPGLISLDVLSEICNTLSTLWHTIPLRKHLVAQFETIFTGFYQRALVLLRKRTHPMNSISFNADLVFDAEVEVILESLVDLLCLHDFRRSIADGDGGSLETLFAIYDCHMSRSDVAAGLMVELCRCCGGCVNEEGDVMSTPISSYPGTPAPTVDSGASTPLRQSTSKGSLPGSRGMIPAETWRPVPPHLKELCAQALMGAMKCLFRDDKASKETLLERSQRELTIMLSGEQLQQDPYDPETSESRVQGENGEEVQDGIVPPPAKSVDSHNNDHFLRNIKSRKRLMRKGATLFNEKASKGIEFLVSAGLFSDPPTPAAVASFLRNGIVVGLNKHAVGAYLGEAGKPRAAGKSPPVWERDYFHQDVLTTYCALFRFEGQSLLDSLRMFLSSFRLPGEAQQIDRILQSFSDTCCQVCEESVNGRLKLFSSDPKKGSDSAYLLSFSIIMLNTDLHNDNIREDRKMKLEDFIRNNTDYGKDITEKGKEFPREFLEGIYESIKEEEIRTEGEGADGCMTIERWKDVLRGSTEEKSADIIPSQHDAEDLTELVLEHVWIPILSAIGAFWGITGTDDFENEPTTPASHVGDGTQKSGMLGVQGARLGMDMALEMLEGVLHLRRVDIFRRIFACVCKYTGLIGEYTADAVARTNAFANSLEAQSGLIVAIQTARSASDDIGVDGWKLVWQMLFELRDLKMLGSDVGEIGRRSILKESESDLLSDFERRYWNMWLIKGDVESAKPKRESSGVSSVFGAFGRVLFGSDDEGYKSERKESLTGVVNNAAPRTPHGKEDFLVWDDLAPSDDEQETNSGLSSRNHSTVGSTLKGQIPRSVGAVFEHSLIQENVMMSQQTEMPVTGLERMEDTRTRHLSPRARVRIRLARACDFHSLISESRFMSTEGIKDMLQSLVEIIKAKPSVTLDESAMDEESKDSGLSPEDIFDLRLPTPPTGNFPLSPGSAALAEVLVCEIALKNKDRLKHFWKDMLEPHFRRRLAGISENLKEKTEVRRTMMDSGIEKCVTGLLRLGACATSKEEVADDILKTWKSILPSSEELPEFSVVGKLHKHVSEGLWRIVNNVDGFSKVGGEGWDGLIALIDWCAARGGQLPPINTVGLVEHVTLAEDDPAFQAYRSLHLMLNTEEVRDKVPHLVVRSLRHVIDAGESRGCYQLSIAGLDLLHNFLEQRGGRFLSLKEKKKIDDVSMEAFWSECWRPSLETMAHAGEAAGSSVSSSPT